MVEHISANLKAEYKEYSQLKQQASSLHDTFLEHLAANQAEDQNLNPVTHLKTLREREWQQKTYQRI